MKAEPKPEPQGKSPMRKLIVLGILMAWSTGLAAQEQTVNLNPGLWEITTVTEMVGMPGAAPPPMTFPQCITPDNLVPQSEGETEVCQVSELAVDGNTVSWKLTCSGQGGGMEGTGTITYNGDTMEGTMEMTMTMANMQVKNTLTGKRIGECKGG